MENSGMIFSMLSALLGYPDETLVEALAEIRAAPARHRAFTPAMRAALLALVDQLAARPLLDLQEDYVEAFDRRRATSLYLFEHVHGESRERGQAEEQTALMIPA